MADESPMNNKKPEKGAETPGGGNSFYWIFAVVAGILLMLTMFGNSNALQKKNPAQLEEMVEAGEVSRILVVNRQLAEVTLNEAALKKDKYRGKSERPLFGMGANTGPHFITQFGDIQNFEEKLRVWHDDYAVNYDFETRHEWGRELLQWVVLLGVMIAVWVFVMRKLSANAKKLLLKKILNL